MPKAGDKNILQTSSVPLPRAGMTTFFQMCLCLHLFCTAVPQKKYLAFSLRSEIDSQYNFACSCWKERLGPSTSNVNKLG